MAKKSKPRREPRGERGAFARYPDLHEHLVALERAGLLVIVDRPINKDTEMHPLVRWQFRGGIEEPDRKAFSSGASSTARSASTTSRRRRRAAASREIYRIGMGCPLEEINETWTRAMAKPIAPRIVESAPCHEIVVEGDELDEPARVWTRCPFRSRRGLGYRPFTTLSQYITRTPTAACRTWHLPGQVKAQRRLGMNPSLELRPASTRTGEDEDARQEAARRGHPRRAALRSRSPRRRRCPSRSTNCTSPAASSVRRSNVVKAKTVDLLVPAEAEIVIEGYIDTEYLEPEAPFGESHGHVNLQEYNRSWKSRALPAQGRDPHLDHLAGDAERVEPDQARGARAAVYAAPAQHARHPGREARLDARAAHQPAQGGGDRGGAKDRAHEIWRALYGAASWNARRGKYVVAVNEDIDPDNADALLWAMSYRANPALDLQILHHRDQGHGPRSKRNGGEDASVLIDATMKEDFPPISLPKREYMERAKAIWEELGLPKLKPEAPWFGYSLGEWSDELEQAAELAVKGDYFETGKLLVKRRRKDVKMNTEVRDLQEPRKK